MSLPANTTTVVGCTTYIQEPMLPQLVNETIALCAAANHSEYLPATVTWTTAGSACVNRPSLIDLVTALRLLGATVPDRWGIEGVLIAIRSLEA